MAGRASVVAGSVAGLCLGFAVVGCTGLPDPKSAGAEVYRVRCSPCHRLYDPGTMTTAMWEMQLDRMQGVMMHRGVNPLTAQERHLVMSYLRAHASDAPADAAAPGPAAASPGGVGSRSPSG